MDQLRLGIASANRSANLIAVYLMDINNLQGVNQSLSYKHGDAVLREVGDRLRYLLRTNDIISRFGGDEFAFLLPDFKLTSMEAVAKKILSVFQEPFTLENAKVDMTANIGICIYPGSGETAESLINNANLALERSKEFGRGHFYLYERTETKS
jgi:diguanylate cyclase (GGDEF)-like protein